MAFVRRNRPWGCGTGEGGCESSDSTHSVHDRRALRQFTRGFTVSSDANLSPSFFPFSPLPFIRSPSSILLPLPSSFTPFYIQRCFNVGRFSRDLFFSPFSFFFFFFHSLLPSRIAFTRAGCWRNYRTVSEIIFKNFRVKLGEGPSLLHPVSVSLSLRSRRVI